MSSPTDFWSKKPISWARYREKRVMRRRATICGCVEGVMSAKARADAHRKKKSDSEKQENLACRDAKEGARQQRKDDLQRVKAPHQLEVVVR